MTETKFTPGPWQTHISEVRGDLCVISERAWICGEILNRVRSIPEEEARANAHLIAAAPELYAALETAIEEINHLRKFAGDNGAMIDDTDFVEGIAALAKARGEA